MRFVAAYTSNLLKCNPIMVGQGAGLLVVEGAGALDHALLRHGHAPLGWV
jgi:hypothetical protein